VVRVFNLGGFDEELAELLMVKVRINSDYGVF